MSLLNRTRNQINERRKVVNDFMIQVDNLTQILQSQEYINANFDKTEINKGITMIAPSVKEFNYKLAQLDSRLNYFNSIEKLTPAHHSGLLELDQDFVVLGDWWYLNITPVLVNMVQTININLGI